MLRYCDLRCMNAKSHICRCPCNGKNHSILRSRRVSPVQSQNHRKPTPMKIFDAFPSKYLKAADLQGNQIKAIMEHVMMEEIKDPKDPDDAKVLPVLYFRGVPKGLVLNKTNAKAIALGYGQETEDWRDKPLILFSAVVEAFGDTMDAIRVKLLRKQDGGPSRPEGRRAYIETSDDPEATAEQTGEDWAQRTADSMIRAARVEMPTTTPESMEEARLRFQMRRSKPATKPIVWDLENNELRAPGPRRDNEAAPEHDQDGVVWEADRERPLTDEEKIEAFRQSLQRANAAMDERIARGPSNIPAKEDGLDIPKEFRRQRVVPIQQSIDWRWSKPAQ
jgi:hypothetical protein